MDINNIGKVIDTAREYEVFKNNLEQLSLLRGMIRAGNAGIRIGADKTELTEYFFKNGDYNDALNEELIDAIIDIVERHKRILEEEIKNL